jgi:glutamyl-tRNA reductase
MLVRFEEESKKEKPKPVLPEGDIDELSKQAGKVEAEILEEEQNVKLTPTEQEIEELEKVLNEITNKKFSTLTEESIPVEEESQENKINRLNYTNRHG